MEPLIIALLVCISIIGLGYTFVEPALSGRSVAAKRQQLVAGGSVRRKAVAEAGSRRQQIMNVIKEIEERESRKNTNTLAQRLEAADLKWTPKNFIMGSCISGVICLSALTIITGQILIGLAGAAIAGFLLPNFYVKQKIKKRQAQFLEEFPNAVEAIVRGIKSGIPLSECFNLVANDAKPPVSTEFKTIVDGQSMGIAVPEAVFKVYERMPLIEMSFFAIVIQIQYKSGGNLAEILASLASTIRERKRMKGKISALSTEAVGSAFIIGALPFFVGSISYLAAPEHMSLLFTTSTGNLAVGASLLLMVIGGLVMRKMINFDI